MPDNHPLRVDVWQIRQVRDHWVVVDRNGLEVADCGTRREDAELIVHCVNAHSDMLRALRASIPYLESMCDNLGGLGRIHDQAVDTLVRARAALDKVVDEHDDARAV